MAIVRLPKRPGLRLSLVEAAPAAHPAAGVVSRAALAWRRKKTAGPDRVTRAGGSVFDQTFLAISGFDSRELRVDYSTTGTGAKAAGAASEKNHFAQAPLFGGVFLRHATIVQQQSV